MPRIATVVGVWIAVLFAIGFNIVHYPVVAEILRPPGGNASATPAATPASTSPAPATTAEAKKAEAPKPEEKPAETPQAEAKKSDVATSADRAAPSDTKPATDRAASSEGPGPDATASAEKTEKADKKGSEKYRVQCDGQSCKLVPVDEPAPAPASQETAAAEPAKPSGPAPVEAVPAAKYATGAEAPAKKAAEVSFSPVSQTIVPATPPMPTASKVRRLPSVDKAWTPPATANYRNDGRIPIYATTGVE